MSEIRGLIDRLASEHRLSREEYIKLTRSPYDIDKDYLFSLARAAADNIYGKNIFLRGLIEITNYCKNDCFYCGIRKSGVSVTRYRLSDIQITECCRRGYESGLRTFVLQGGEDPGFTDKHICSLVSVIKHNCPEAAITLSLGEKPYESYALYRKAGVDRYLLRHETANAEHYAFLHPPEMSFINRRRCLNDLLSLGYQTGAGFMVSPPGQTPETLADNLLYLQELQPQMIGIGPYIPQKDTPFFDKPSGCAELTLILLAIVRLMLPNSLLPATTALGTLAENGYERGILAGANVIMLNLTPAAEREHYKIYDGKNSAKSGGLELISEKIDGIGYRVSMERGDYISL